jgi:hypothetical protein
MSEAASVPYSETKAPEAPERLHRGALGLVDISASTMANIGPAAAWLSRRDPGLGDRVGSIVADE